MGKSTKVPKVKCCVSKSKCGRCPLRMLKEGTLPAGYSVKRRVLVEVGSKGQVKKVNKSDLQTAIKRQTKKSKKKIAA